MIDFSSGDIDDIGYTNRFELKHLPSVQACMRG